MTGTRAGQTSDAFNERGYYLEPYAVVYIYGMLRCCYIINERRAHCDIVKVSETASLETLDRYPFVSVLRN